ncbi:hypothetical protein H110_08819, partial [Trichophyton rubrum MR1448]
MAPRRGSRPVAMRLEATVTATVDGKNSRSGQVLCCACKGCCKEGQIIRSRKGRQRAELRPGIVTFSSSLWVLLLVPSPSRWIFDVGSFDVAEPRRDSVRPGLGRYAAPEVTRALTEEMIIWEEEDDVDVGSSSGGGC